MSLKHSIEERSHINLFIGVASAGKWILQSGPECSRLAAPLSSRGSTAGCKVNGHMLRVTQEAFGTTQGRGPQNVDHELVASETTGVVDGSIKNLGPSSNYLTQISGETVWEYAS